jgi:hypothetical protein
MARQRMFAVRLDEREWNALESLLKLAESEVNEDSLSVKFRFMVLEMDGRLHRNYVHYLKLKPGLHEANLRDL